ncbi:hypothetical protein ANTPLA_LOCUS2891 [Anthophora plagiata]
MEKSHIRKKESRLFPSLNDNTAEEIILAITEHLTLLEEKIERYFPSINEKLRVAISNIRPNIAAICKSRQAQVPH